MLELPGLFLCLRGGGGGGKKIGGGGVGGGGGGGGGGAKKIAGMWLARGWSGDYPGSHYGIIK